MRRKLPILAIFVATAPVPAAAQHMIDLPIWSNGILGQSALRNTYDNFNKANGLDKKKTEPSRACSSDALPAADRKRMEAEYVRRARADGKASADAWVHEQGRRFHTKLVAEGVCPAPDSKGKRVADNSSSSSSKKPLDKNGRPCTRTRLEHRPIANVGGGAMTMGMVPVCAD